MEYSKALYKGCLVKGRLREAIAYLKQFPEKEELYNKYVSVFENEQYLTYEADSLLNEILLAFQKYYRDVFYLEIGRETAEKQLISRVAAIFGDKNLIKETENIEKHIENAFTSRGFYCMNGLTGGYYGPYIWKNEEVRKYNVQLPEGTADFTVKLLNGFISCSWLDYISFGEFGASGWTDRAGIINCVKKRYDLNDESFCVSLLKHEAQHSVDLKKYKDITSEQLEYRAKLVELIYSEKRMLLPEFVSQADVSDPANGHALAAERIAKGFEKITGLNRGRFGEISAAEIREISMKLFNESSAAL